MREQSRPQFGRAVWLDDGDLLYLAEIIQQARALLGLGDAGIALDGWLASQTGLAKLTRSCCEVSSLIRKCAPRKSGVNMFVLLALAGSFKEHGGAVGSPVK